MSQRRDRSVPRPVSPSARNSTHAPHAPSAPAPAWPAESTEPAGATPPVGARPDHMFLPQGLGRSRTAVMCTVTSACAAARPRGCSPPVSTISSEGAIARRGRSSVMAALATASSNEEKAAARARGAAVPGQYGMRTLPASRGCAVGSTSGRAAPELRSGRLLGTPLAALSPAASPGSRGGGAAAASAAPAGVGAAPPAAASEAHVPSACSAAETAATAAAASASALASQADQSVTAAATRWISPIWAGARCAFTVPKARAVARRARRPE
eukprot:scaffold26569_cov107-Isochrysis_galbana.AAC.3